MLIPVQEPERILAVRDSIFALDKYQWAQSEGGVLQVLSNWFDRLIEFLKGLEQSHPLVHAILTWGLIILLIALLVHVAYTVFTALSFSSANDDDSVPGLEVRDAEWYRARARQLAASGHFREAIAHRFIAAARHLGNQHFLSYHPSKTPLEYLDEIENQSVRARLSEVVGDLYSHLFGSIQSDTQTWVRFDSSLTQLETNAPPH